MVWLVINVFDDLKDEVELFFNDLNWTYILMYVFILYGIKNKEEFQWYNNLTDKYGSFKIWIAGLITASFFLFFKYLNTGLNSEYISQLLRSLVIVIIFNSIFSKNISKKFIIFVI
jgi:hypothetical protein